MATATDNHSITIENVGPIHELKLPIPAGGGLVLIRGRQGCGKSTAIRALESFASGKGKVSVRDKCKFGSVKGMGATLRVGRSTTRAGELELESIEDYEPIADLVDPGIDKPEAADAKRIKALIQLSGVKPDPSLFHELLGGQEAFEAVVTDTDVDDLVALAGKVKRQCEEAARKHEQQADVADGHAKANREAAAGVDLDVEADAVKLQAALEAAVRTESELKAEDRHAGQLITDAQRASDALEDAAAEYSGKNSVTAKTQLDMCAEVQEKAKERCRELMDLLEEAKHELEQAVKAKEHAESELRTALAHEKVVADFRKQVEAAKEVARVPADDMAKATEAVTEARKAIERGALIREARNKLDQATVSAKKAAAHRIEAIKLRDAAKGTDEVLSSAVGADSGLRVEAGRLVIDTARGPTYFAELSHGERALLALDLAINAIGPHGVLPISQEFFAALQPENQRKIAERLRERDTTGIAPFVDDGELRAELFDCEA